MTNTGFGRGFLPRDYGYDRASAWIMEHASILLPQFIDDMYKSFDNTSFFHVPDYVEVAKQVCKQIPNEFRVAVRQSSIGENAFRKGLYKMSQRSVELLTNTLQSSLSLRQRCTAAELLVHLSVINQVSAMEVQNLLTAAIDDVQSSQIVASLDSSIRSDEELRSLLIRLLVEQPKPMKSGGTIDIINETLYIPIPAAIFQTRNEGQKQFIFLHTFFKHNVLLQNSD